MMRNWQIQVFQANQQSDIKRLVENTIKLQQKNIQLEEQLSEVKLKNNDLTREISFLQDQRYLLKKRILDMENQLQLDNEVYQVNKSQMRSQFVNKDKEKKQPKQQKQRKQQKQQKQRKKENIKQQSSQKQNTRPVNQQEIFFSTLLKLVNGFEKIMQNNEKKQKQKQDKKNKFTKKNMNQQKIKKSQETNSSKKKQQNVIKTKQKNIKKQQKRNSTKNPQNEHISNAQFYPVYKPIYSHIQNSTFQKIYSEDSSTPSRSFNYDYDDNNIPSSSQSIQKKQLDKINQNKSITYQQQEKQMKQKLRNFLDYGEQQQQTNKAYPNNLDKISSKNNQIQQEYDWIGQKLKYKSYSLENIKQTSKDNKQIIIQKQCQPQIVEQLYFTNKQNKIQQDFQSSLIIQSNDLNGPSNHNDQSYQDQQLINELSFDFSQFKDNKKFQRQLKKKQFSRILKQGIKGSMKPWKKIFQNQLKKGQKQQKIINNNISNKDKDNLIKTQQDEIMQQQIDILANEMSSMQSSTSQIKQKEQLITQNLIIQQKPNNIISQQKKITKKQNKYDQIDD